MSSILSSVLSSIRDYDHSSLLDSLSTSGTTSSDSTIDSDSSTLNSSSMTISQIRDANAELALEGKSTDQEQTALMTARLQDDSAADSSYQKTVSAGDSSSDPGTYTLASTTSGVDLAISTESTPATASYGDIARAIQGDENISTGSGVSLSA